MDVSFLQANPKLVGFDGEGAQFFQSLRELTENAVDACREVSDRRAAKVRRCDSGRRGPDSGRMRLGPAGLRAPRVRDKTDREGRARREAADTTNILAQDAPKLLGRKGVEPRLAGDKHGQA